MKLATSPEVSDVFRTVYFQEKLSKNRDSITMSFDYKLRQGVATAKNSLKLLEAVGIIFTEGEPVTL